MRFRLLLLLSVCLIPLLSSAQTGQASDSLKQKAVVKETSSQTEEEVLGTNESIKYMGSKLWFQMKKRLNLTSKEEEEAELKADKKVVLTFGSLRIED